ncbi:hypothetical protein SKAU_G00138800 [Synaphobranchus kaupii]|uniref:Uncharacterized protein n=1 Tax=Synaphobranchus kaupii TaxID=118154 RepID=A0A9Q1FS61_SYNKA|nr:hypothetical protein SKAU_G00138800 [Synaphobranchus kaupii]
MGTTLKLQLLQVQRSCSWCAVIAKRSSRISARSSWSSMRKATRCAPSAHSSVTAWISMALRSMSTATRSRVMS